MLKTLRNLAIGLIVATASLFAMGSVAQADELKIGDVPGILSGCAMPQVVEAKLVPMGQVWLVDLAPIHLAKKVSDICVRDFYVALGDSFLPGGAERSIEMGRRLHAIKVLGDEIILLESYATFLGGYGWCDCYTISWFDHPGFFETIVRGQDREMKLIGYGVLP